MSSLHSSHTRVIARKKRPTAAGISLRILLLCGVRAPSALFVSKAQAFTLADLNPWKQVRECRIFSLTRSRPVGVRILIVPVIDEPINAPIYTRLSTEFANSLRSFANEVWLVTDLPDNPVKQGFYTAIPRIVADYRLRNYLSMDLLQRMIPDFECDYIALFEVTNYDRYWIDEDLQHRVGVRAVFYDYEDGQPRIEKYWEGGRGRRLEEGAFSEAERMAVKGLVEQLEKPLRASIEQREEELQMRSDEVMRLASLTATQEYAVHKTDLADMQGKIQAALTQAAQANEKVVATSQELQFWRQQAAERQALLEQERARAQTEAPPQSEGKSILPLPPRIETPPSMNPPSPPPAPEASNESPPQADAVEIPSGWTSPPARNDSPVAVPRPLAGNSRNVALRMDWDAIPGESWEYVGPEPRDLSQPESFPGHAGPEVIRVK